MILNERYGDRFGSLLSFLWRLRDLKHFRIEGNKLQIQPNMKHQQACTTCYYCTQINADFF